MDKDVVISAFIRKRNLFKNLCFFSLFCVIIFGIVIPDLFPAFTTGQYENAHRISVVLWFAATCFLGNYVSNTLSICPVCHIHIPTVTPRKRIPREKYGKVPGMGPLPDYCPYCGADFRNNN